MALAIAGALGFGAWAVALRVPREAYYVQWEPVRPRYAPFNGRLTALALDGLTLRPGQVILPEQLPAAFFDSLVSLAAEVVPRPQPNGIALIARIALSPGELFMLGRQGDALVARYRANVHEAGLRSPMYALDRAFRAEPVAALIQLHLGSGTVELRARTGQSTTMARHRVTTARAWATLLPFEYGFGAFAILGDLLWLALLFTPVAYGVGRQGAPRWGFAPLVALTAWLALIALRWQPSLWWWPYWLSIAVTCGVGAWLGTRARRRLTNRSHPRGAA